MWHDSFDQRGSPTHTHRYGELAYRDLPLAMFRPVLAIIDTALGRRTNGHEMREPSDAPDALRNTPLLSSSWLVENVGITYRQLDNWITFGYLTSATGKHPGQGRARMFSPVEAEIARRMKILIVGGFTVPAAAKLARRSIVEKELVLDHNSPTDLTLLHAWESNRQG